jgi:iron complex outermembrane receptor protein
MGNNVAVTTPGTVPDYRMQQALLGLVPDSTGKLQWVPDASPAARTYFNWFGLNSQAMADFLTISNPQVAKNQLTTYDVHLSGPVAQLPGGDLAVSIGAERYTQSIEFTQTDLNATGNIVGGSNGASWAGSRSVNAVYAEVDAPITKWMEAQVAGRYESYSDDGFQKRVRPKLGLKFRPLDWLVIRGSYSQAYQAPDLGYLYETQIVTFTSGQYADPAYPSQPKTQLQMNVTGDPDLKPQTTDVYFAGIYVEPHKGILKGLNASLDYFHYSQKNLLAQLTDFYS